ncbi:MAG: GNAT family N-acetyltransferase [Candidatus Omnitrophota bacterium]
MDKNSGLEYLILTSINDIPSNDWDNLFGKDIIEGYGYHKTLEESHLREFSFYYLIAKRNQKIVAIFPFFTTDFSFATLFPDPLEKIIFNIQKVFHRFLKMHLLFVGSLAAEEIYLGCSKDENLNLIAEEAVNKLHGFLAQKKISSILFYNLTKKNSRLIFNLKAKGFKLMESFPNSVIKINVCSLQEYVNNLGPNTRKDLRRKLKKSAALTTLKTELRDDLAGIENEVYRLYLNNLQDSGVSFERLTLDFFRNIFKNMPEVAKLFITRDKNKIVAFNLMFIKDKVCIDKFIGFDRQLSHKYHLYHNTFCHNIDYCIKNCITTYQLGVTDYHPKVRLGAKLIPLYILVKTFNPVLRLFSGLIIRVIEPKKFDPILRNISNYEAGSTDLLH